MNAWQTAATIAGLTAVTLATRCFFLFPEREVVLPAWARRGLRYAPLAAIAAVVVPEILMTHGEFFVTWRDARLFGAVAATLWYAWRRDILGTIVTGMVVMLPLRIVMGW